MRHAVTMGPGTLYGSIKRMLKGGLIRESHERPDPALDDTRLRYYALTGEGRRVLEAESRFVLLGLGLIYLAILVVYRSQNRPAAWVLPVLGLAGVYTVFWVLFLLSGAWPWLDEHIPIPLVYLLPAAVVVLAKSIRPPNLSTLVLFAVLLAASVGVFMVQGGYSIAAGNNALEAQALILFAAALGLAFIEVIRIKD